MPTPPPPRKIEVLLEEDILRYLECEGKDCGQEAARILKDYVETMMQERDA